MSKVGKKQFFKFGNKDMGRWFNYSTWRRLTEGEQNQWEPVDDKPFPNEEKLTKEQEYKNALATQQRRGLEDLRLKVGQKFDDYGIEVEIVQWGVNRHLVKSKKKGSGGMHKYGTLPRLTIDTSYGAKDILKEKTPYSRYRTMDEAKREYKKANE